MLRRRLTAQLLAGRARAEPGRRRRAACSPSQAQDPRGARLAVRARTRGVERAPTSTGRSAEERSLVITWLQPRHPAPGAPARTTTGCTR